MSLALLLAALSCGRIGFDPTKRAADSGILASPPQLGTQSTADSSTEPLPEAQDVSDASGDTPIDSLDSTTDGGSGGSSTNPIVASDASARLLDASAQPPEPTDGGNPSNTPMAAIDSGTVEVDGSALDASQGGSLDGGDSGSSAFQFPSDCSGQPSSSLFSFDTDTSGWILSAAEVFPMDVQWQASGGTPAADGVLLVNTTPGAEVAYLNQPMTATDLSGAVISARVYVETGSDVRLKLYMQSGTTFAWTDGGRIDPPAGEWVCVSFDTSSPSALGADFDAAETVEVGMQIAGTGDLTVYVDDFRY